MEERSSHEIVNQTKYMALKAENVFAKDIKDFYLVKEATKTFLKRMKESHFEELLFPSFHALSPSGPVFHIENICVPLRF